MRPGDGRAIGEEGAMKYVCLVYFEETKLDAMSRSESDTLQGECETYREEIGKNGYYVTSAALQPVETATTLRMRNGRMSTTDGPFAETKEQLGGFYLIEARDLNEAIEVASRIPPARLGSVEIRPVRDITQPWPRARSA
jgi:hypothetical protein